jgi:acyl-CoA reductase-like NAD-dependent aldehyde dehydrogenase
MLEIVNPATEETIERLESDTAETLQAKFEAARQSQPDWDETPLSERVAAIAQFRDLLGESIDNLAETLTAEMGKPLWQARGEISATRDRIDYFLENVASALSPDVVYDEPDLVEKTTWEPLGVVANISAWNYPYFVGSNVWIPALLTGNAVIYKPSEHSSLTGLAIANLLWEAGIPPNVFHVAVGGSEVGKELLAHPIDGVFFTGSVRTGQKIASEVASRFVKVQLELGGKDPAYVCDDVDPASAAAALAEGAFYNTGQSCCSVERIYVHEDVADAFLEAFVAEVSGYRVGDPMDEETYIGPLARKEQLSVLELQVADAAQKGARLLHGGKRRGGTGYFFEPTVFAAADHTMELMREESFGPIIGIQTVADDDEAVVKMLDTDYGLTSAVYTHDRQRAERILKRMDTGSVYWNCCDRVSPRLPWSGRRNSGIGSTLSFEGIRAFLRPKAWHLRG